jgi:hypothetical protein
MEKKDIEEAFYRECAVILGITTDYVASRPASYYSAYDEKVVTRSTRATRFTHRAPGNGRYVGYGVIRMFSPDMIHVALTQPKLVNQIFTSLEEALAFLRELVGGTEDV